VTGIARAAHRQPVQPSPYVHRGKAGMTVIAWLADIADRVSGAGPLVAIGDAVVGAAADWIEATLSIGESVASDAAPAATTIAPPPPPPASSSWAALGG
jgi:hypothetical protein